MTPKIIVAGGGIGGLTAAIALKKFGADVQVLEREPAFAPVGAGITIQANAHAILSALGIDLPAEDVTPLGAFRMVNPQGHVLMSGDASNIDIATPSVNIHRADLHRALDTAAQQLNIPRQLDAAVHTVSAQDQQVLVHFGQGQQTTCDLLVGADGIHSSTRRSLLGDRDTAHRQSGQMCWRFASSAPELVPDETVEYWAPGRRIGVVPLSRGRIYVYMVMSHWFSKIPLPSKERLAEGPNHQKATLQEIFGGIASSFDRVLEQLDPSVPIHQDDLVDQPHLHFGQGRALLIGDAAHAMTPNLGQGAGMAIEDAATLALLYHEQPDRLDTFAAELTQRRLARVKKIQTMSWRIGRIAHTKNPLLRTLRDLLLRCMPSASTERQADTLWSPGLELGKQLSTKLV